MTSVFGADKRWSRYHRGTTLSDSLLSGPSFHHSTEQSVASEEGFVYNLSACTILHKETPSSSQLAHGKSTGFLRQVEKCVFLCVLAHPSPYGERDGKCTSVQKPNHFGAADRVERGLSFIPMHERGTAKQTENESRTTLLGSVLAGINIHRHPNGTLPTGGDGCSVRFPARRLRPACTQRGNRRKSTSPSSSSSSGGLPVGLRWWHAQIVVHHFPVA